MHACAPLIDKMAADERISGSIIKGTKLTVVVEEANNDVIVVVLHHDTKTYRGVLLHSTESSWNYVPFKDRADCENAIDQKPVDMSATVFRHTYFPNMTHYNINNQEAPQRNFPKLGNNRPTGRNIRLRPRQTLCSQCKSTCLDSQNGPIPISSAVASSPSKQPNTKLEIKPQRKKVLDHESEPKPTKLIRVNSDPKLTRTSPFIKISIGDTNVMNIPPRLHEFDRQVSSDTEKSAEEEIDENEVIVKTESNSYKRMLRHSQDEKSNSDDSSKKRRNTSSQSKKSKREKTKPKEFDESDNDLPPNIIITENVDTSEDSEDLGENGENKRIGCSRPRLIYTWRQNKGLSPMHMSNLSENQDGQLPNSQSEILANPLENLDGTALHEVEEKKIKPSIKSSRKEYKLRSRSRSLDSNTEYEITEDSAYISYEDPKSVSDRSEGCSTEIESHSDSESDYEEGPPGEEQVDAFKPLMMKIHTSSVSKCSIPDGRKLQTGDIVWGKVKGFPWWPGRIMTINVSQKDNAVVIRQIAQVAWFGSSTMSHISCSDLYPFLQEFKIRFNRKKRSTPYRRAIKQATIAAQMCEPHSEIGIEEEFDVT